MEYLTVVALRKIVSDSLQRWEMGVAWSSEVNYYITVLEEQHLCIAIIINFVFLNQILQWNQANMFLL